MAGLFYPCLISHRRVLLNSVWLFSPRLMISSMTEILFSLLHKVKKSIAGNVFIIICSRRAENLLLSFRDFSASGLPFFSRKMISPAPYSVMEKISIYQQAMNDQSGSI